jgi:putative transposase
LEKYHRQSIRLKNYDYSKPGAYFITICIHGRMNLLGDIVDKIIYLNPAGEMIKDHWQSLPERYPFVELDTFVVMPNHVHGIILFDNNNNLIKLGDVIGSFKSITTNAYISGIKNNDWTPFWKKLWQRNYYEHIIRNYEDMDHIRKYIIYNPLNWKYDRENPLSLPAKQNNKKEPWQV